MIIQHRVLCFFGCQRFPASLHKLLAREDAGEKHAYVLCNLATLSSPHLCPFFATSVKEKRYNPIIRKIQKENVGHVSEAYGPSSAQTCGPHQAQKGQGFGFLFFLKLFSVKKRERETENRRGFCGPPLSGGDRLLSVLELWVCDSRELPSGGFVISLEL